MCLILVLAAVSCASGGTPAGTPSYETAKVYLVGQGPVPGESGDFWTGLTGTRVDKRPWGGSAGDSAAGVFYLAADEKNLYMRAEISDSGPQVRPGDMDPATAWNGCSIELFFGTKTARHSEYEEGDTHITLWVIQQGEDLKVRAAKSGRLLNERQARTAPVEWTENSYTIEAAFPNSVAGVFKELRANQSVRAEFRINHAKPDGERSVIVNWRDPGDECHRNPNAWSFGTVVKRGD